MPKPVPIPVRRKLLQRARRGDSPALLAAQFDLPIRTVRHLLKRFRERGESRLPRPGLLAPRLPRCGPRGRFGSPP
jgi:DNA-directed RNA polymerase specialized sigma24 family protein